MHSKVLKELLSFNVTGVWNQTGYNALSLKTTEATSVMEWSLAIHKIVYMAG